MFLSSSLLIWEFPWVLLTIRNMYHIANKYHIMETEHISMHELYHRILERPSLFAKAVLLPFKNELF